MILSSVVLQCSKCNLSSCCSCLPDASTQCSQYMLSHFSYEILFKILLKGFKHTSLLCRMLCSMFDRCFQSIQYVFVHLHTVGVHQILQFIRGMCGLWASQYVTGMLTSMNIYQLGKLLNICYASCSLCVNESGTLLCCKNTVDCILQNHCSALPGPTSTRA